MTSDNQVGKIIKIPYNEKYKTTTVRLNVEQYRAVRIKLIEDNASLQSLLETAFDLYLSGKFQVQ